jgi:hypothetical protein
MQRLTASDLRAILRNVHEIYRHTDMATLPARMLACVRSLVPCDSAAYEEFNLLKNRVIGLTDPVEARPGAAALRVFEHFVPEHPVRSRSPARAACCGCARSPMPMGNGSSFFSIAT